MIRKKYCGTVAKVFGNAGNKPYPKTTGVPYLLKKTGFVTCAAMTLVMSMVSLADVVGPAPSVLSAAVFATEQSASAGIQEAIDALFPHGGAVTVPPGVHVLHRPLLLTSNVRLTGAGRATVLKKGAGHRLTLTEDAKKGQDYIVVSETNHVRIGAVYAIGDRIRCPAIWGKNRGLYTVTNRVGNRLYLEDFWTGGGLAGDISVTNGASAINNIYPMILTRSGDHIIEDMELDGNIGEQEKAAAAAIGWNIGYLMYGIYAVPGKVERCWIHDFHIGIHISTGLGAEISHSHIYRNSGDGIHAGGGPHSVIVHNKIYDNMSDGIRFCYGNRKLIITGNEIMRNRIGISGMNSGAAYEERDTIVDRSSIISQNIIYENQLAGMDSTRQGHTGPQDFVFTGNILHNNQQKRARNDAAAGLLFVNPQRCVIANNRCYDDRAIFPSYMLTQPAPVGASNLVVTLAKGPVFSEPVFIEGDGIQVGTGAEAAVYTVRQVGKSRASGNPMCRFAWDVFLDQPVNREWLEGTPVARMAAQHWGIAVLGEGARGNVISGNVCVGNLSGGILIQGIENNVVANNSGTVVLYDEQKPPKENYFPIVSNGSLK